MKRPRGGRAGWGEGGFWLVVIVLQPDGDQFLDDHAGQGGDHGASRKGKGQPEWLAYLVPFFL